MLLNSEIKDLTCIDSSASERIIFVRSTVKNAAIDQKILRCIASKIHLRLIYWFKTPERESPERCERAFPRTGVRPAGYTVVRWWKAAIVQALSPAAAMVNAMPRRKVSVVEAGKV